MARKRAKAATGDDPLDHRDDDHLVDDEGDDGARGETSDAPRKITAKDRQEHLTLLYGLRQQGIHLLRQRGFEQPKTEAIGDCWLIALLAGCELEVSLVPNLSANQRKEHLSPWRQRLAEFAPHIDTKGLDKNGVPLGIDYLKAIADHFSVSVSVIQQCEKKDDWQRTRTAISTKVKPWKKDFHFGDHQPGVHVCMGLMLQKNILQIELSAGVAAGASKSHQFARMIPITCTQTDADCALCCSHSPLRRLGVVGFAQHAVTWDAP